ncbi:ABC transporter arginine-binding protein 1 precursor [Legionella massiliensis]|uniref:ABC transporter arginine-binding protein 1 n=1 Tax=Legionella massiliensis TaxID=1034943 RepID=A0A078KPG9_9GAMM|nr:transporter substrate-binding domain-containing protein [Legionella massiliensis]CDZ76300.1 ABC transporter arginine-binding protein 1 precursor [Legionella massiliensis]CEE12038.1 ABC transporter arginine-binding protein 1 precursor [Legionella massiliensis]
MKFYRAVFICFLAFTSVLHADERILKVAVSAYEPPFVIQESNNKFYGFDIALIEAICRSINYRCQYIPMPFSRLLPAIESNQVDMAVGSIFITPERANRVLFSSPYFLSRLRFLVRGATKDGSLNAQAFAGRNIGVTNTSFTAPLKQWGVKNSQIVNYKQEDALVKALNNGYIQFALLDNSTAVYWHQNSSGNLKVFGPPIIFGYGVGIAISPKNAALVSPINEALLKYQNSPGFTLNFHKYLAAIYDF